MATPERYIPGQLIRLSIAVEDIAEAAQDPGALRLLVKAPDATTTLYTYGTDAEIVRDAAGGYHADILLDAAGQWRYRWEGDAPFAGAAEGFVVVNPSLLA